MSTNNNKSFFQTLPGIMTATATLITAIVGLITVLNQVGLIGNKDKPKIEKVVADDSESKKNTSDLTNVADLEKIIRKVMKEENASKGKSKAELEEAVSRIVKEVKQEEKSKAASNSEIESITRAYLQKKEAIYDKRDDDGFSGGGSGGVAITNSPVRIGGKWNDYNTGASYVFAQNGNTVNFQEHSLNDFGQPIVSAEGTGSISGRNIQINYMTMFGTSGVANLTVAPDNSNISCTFRDNTSGVTMNMNLMR